MKKEEEARPLVRVIALSFFSAVTWIVRWQKGEWHILKKHTLLITTEQVEEEDPVVTQLTLVYLENL